MVRICTLACAVLLACTALARAATINTSAIPAETGQPLQCVAVNAKNKPLEVALTVSFVAATGALTGRVGTDPLSVPPGEAGVLSVPLSSGNAAAYCTLFVRGGKSAVRGLLCNVATGACSEAR